MVIPALVLPPPRLGVAMAGLGIGLVVSVIGHLARSRTLIITGILAIALVSVYVLASGYSYTLTR